MARIRVSSCGLIGRSRLCAPDGQSLQEPALVLALDLAVLGEVVEGALHQLGELRVALAEHDAVGVVGEEFADHLVLASAPCAARAGRRAARRRWRRRRPCRPRAARRTRAWSRALARRKSILKRRAISRIAFSLVVPAVTTTVLPARLRYERIGEPCFTSSLVPATKMIGEKATCFCRSRLLVVEPHSRSAWPETIASMRVSEVTGSHLSASSRPIASPIASPASCRARSSSRSARRAPKGTRTAPTTRGRRW